MLPHLGSIVLRYGFFEGGMVLESVSRWSELLFSDTGKGRHRGWKYVVRYHYLVKLPIKASTRMRRITSPTTFPSNGSKY